MHLNFSAHFYTKPLEFETSKRLKKFQKHDKISKMQIFKVKTFTIFKFNNWIFLVYNFLKLNFKPFKIFEVIYVRNPQILGNLF